MGHSVGMHKDAKLVHRAFAKSKINLKAVQCFHTDRGKESDNKMIDETLEVFGIKRSLSNAGNPYDNAVAEATFKTFKTEFINNCRFESIEGLEYKLSDYVNWYNTKRIHGSLGYISPVDYRIARSL